MNENSPSATPIGLPATAPSTEALITLGGGCFWCLEAVFERVRGVLDVESGYCNGQTPSPSYEQVCSGQTGHAEVVRVRFDPAQVSLQELLAVFFAIHDPTSLNRQGADVGTQYRSGIYTHSPEQEALAREVLAQAQSALGGRVVTELLPERNYHPAEAYHRHYFARNPEQGYCVFVVAAKVKKFEAAFQRLMRESQSR
ncbi:peptide-methionine (S)-S-oxide reductase MsrA [Roseateles sp. BYS180W]|uniref:Peptide methionine sulfoxide reductase MsrA n=1 Tax=Roseateles rivi TaxID=3299028 RepID=A0ABW7FZJ7_9BURK